MRIFLAGILCCATSAAADPQVKCFEGTETAKIGRLEKSFRAVMKRTIDQAASEIRQQGWTEKDPAKERAIVYKVDVKTNTFTANDSELGANGTGTLVGKPWQWTSYNLKVTSKDIVFDLVGELHDDAIRSHGTITKDGKQIGTLLVNGLAFDCAKLDEHRAALAKK